MSEDKMPDGIAKWDQVDNDIGEAGLVSYHVAAFKEGVKACAAIKDAEIARQMTIQVEWAELARKQEEDIASRDAVIKELREALHNIHCNWDEMYPEDIDKVITEALANSEHHNSHALDNMLLEARVDELEISVDDSNAKFERLRNLKSKLAELNKE